MIEEILLTEFYFFLIKECLYQLRLSKEWSKFNFLLTTKHDSWSIFMVHHIIYPKFRKLINNFQRLMVFS